MLNKMKVILTGCLIILTVLANAFSPTDSVGIQKIGNQFVIIHKVDKGEGLLALARRYNVTVSDIQALNNGLKAPTIGQKIKIPISAQVAKPLTDSTKITVDQSHANADSKEFSGEKKHTVAAGETIAKIAAKYKISTQQLIKWNSIKNNTVAVGQELRVSGATSIKPYEKWNQANGTGAKVDSPKNVLSSPVKYIEEYGLPVEMEKISHPTLPIGTFIICINPENQKQLLLQVEQNKILNEKCIIGLPQSKITQLEISTQLPLLIKYNLP
jgi:LysM repeat protein